MGNTVQFPNLSFLAFPGKDNFPETPSMSEVTTEPWNIYPENAPPVFVGSTGYCIISEA